LRTIDERLVAASADACFRAAADVERWPDILPHYRWVRFWRKDGFAQGVVEMAAWRHFGPLAYPTWWVSEMEHDETRRTVTYRHIEGITRGMDVLWEVLPNGDGRTTLVRIVHEWGGPAWPLLGGLAADQVIGPHFIHFIASRTLAGVARDAEGAGTEIDR
jgi:ribosome-associated toxin RatA of RatAB toxin-antitoxin module